MPRSKWYVVTIGKKPGVYTSWEEVGPKVLGIPNSVYKSYGTEDDAFRAYGKARMAGLTQVVGVSAIESSNAVESGISVNSGPTTAVENNAKSQNTVSLPSHSPSASRHQNQLFATKSSSRTQEPISKPRSHAHFSKAKRIKEIEEERLSISVPSTPSRPSATPRGPNRDGNRDVPSSSRSRVKSAKGKEVASPGCLLSDTVPSTPSLSPVMTRLSKSDNEESFPNPSSDDRRVRSKRRDKVRSQNGGPPHEVEETSPVSSYSGTGLTYLSDRPEAFQHDFPLRSCKPSPQPTFADTIFCLSSPPTGITQFDPSDQTNSPNTTYSSHPQPSFYPLPLSSTGYCQCDMVCPNCHRPKIIYVVTCQPQMPSQPVNFNSNDCQDSASPFHGVPVPFSPVHVANMVHDSACDPRSPVARGTAVPQFLGSISPIFGRPSPLVTLDAPFSSISH